MRLNGPSHTAQVPHCALPQPHDGGTVASTKKPGMLLRLPAVMMRCGLGRSSIYAGVKAGTFPAPVRLSARAVGWREENLDRWVSERVKIDGAA